MCFPLLNFILILIYIFKNLYYLQTKLFISTVKLLFTLFKVKRFNSHIEAHSIIFFKNKLKVYLYFIRIHYLFIFSYSILWVIPLTLFFFWYFFIFRVFLFFFLAYSKVETYSAYITTVTLNTVNRENTWLCKKYLLFRFYLKIKKLLSVFFIELILKTHKLKYARFTVI